MSDWYSEGFNLVKEEISEETGFSVEAVAAIYNKLSSLGLIDSDAEKDVFWDFFYDEFDPDDDYDDEDDYDDNLYDERDE